METFGYIKKFISDMKKMNLEFDYDYEYNSNVDEFVMFHNSIELKNSEFLDNEITSKILDSFIKHFYNNDISNIHLDYQPDKCFIGIEKINVWDTTLFDFPKIMIKPNKYGTFNFTNIDLLREAV